MSRDLGEGWAKTSDHRRKDKWETFNNWVARNVRKARFQIVTCLKKTNGSASDSEVIHCSVQCRAMISLSVCMHACLSLQVVLGICSTKHTCYIKQWICVCWCGVSMCVCVWERETDRQTDRHRHNHYKLFQAENIYLSFTMNNVCSIRGLQRHKNNSLRKLLNTCFSFRRTHSNPLQCKL